MIDRTAVITGPNSNLINDGTMRLQHSQLTVDGSLAGYGSVVALDSTITADSSVPVQETYIPGELPKPDATVTATSIYPSEAIVLKDSTFNIGSGTPSSAAGNPINFWTAPVVMDSASTVNLESAFSVYAGHSFGVYGLGGNGNLGTVNIEDGPTVISGTMTVDANIVQTNNPHPYIEIYGGRLAVYGSVSGGNVSIISGTLEFQQMAFTHGPELESQKFTSTLSFNGTSGAVQFDGAIGPLTLGINIPLKEIAVFNEGEQIANFHLGPAAPGTYSAANFSVKGDQLLYHHS